MNRVTSTCGGRIDFLWQSRGAPHPCHETNKSSRLDRERSEPGERFTEPLIVLTRRQFEQHATPSRCHHPRLAYPQIQKALETQHRSTWSHSVLYGTMAETTCSIWICGKASRPAQRSESMLGWPPEIRSGHGTVPTHAGADLRVEGSRVLHRGQESREC